MQEQESKRLEKIKNIYDESISFPFIQLLMDIETLIEKINLLSDQKERKKKYIQINK